LSVFDPHGLLPGALLELGLALPPAVCDRLLAHLGLISKWNQVYNLTAVRDPADMVTHHLLDSLAAVRPLAEFLVRPPVWSPAEGAPQQTVTHVLDVGSGAGFPGVTLAMALPEVLAHSCGAGVGRASVRVTCVDAVAKKAAFIRQVAVELGLGALTAAHGRIEAMATASADVITCRAFANLSDIVRLTSRHLVPGGVWMAFKGVLPHDEIAALPADIEVFHVEPLRVPGLDARRCLIWMRQRRST